MLYKDRKEAGQRLAAGLSNYANRTDLIVLGLPRGGVPVAYEVASALNAPLDVFVVRKLGLPGNEELAMGAIASGGIRVLNEEVLAYLRDPESALADVTEKETRELELREQKYRDNRPFPDLLDRTVILVDDGLATGSTMKAAVKAVRQKNPRRLVVAVPVSARSTCREVREEVDDIVCLEMPEPFYAVGQAYIDFSPTSDQEVRELLARASEREDKPS
jgi:putative phosphoribosyl transferase